jgi:hypothetical protein
MPGGLCSFQGQPQPQGGLFCSRDRVERGSSLKGVIQTDTALGQHHSRAQFVLVILEHPLRSGTVRLFVGHREKRQLVWITRVQILEKLHGQQVHDREPLGVAGTPAPHHSVHTVAAVGSVLPSLGRPVILR